MKNLPSQLLLDKYFHLTGEKVEPTLKNGRQVKGILAGYYPEDTEASETSVHHWHIVDETAHLSTGYDAFMKMGGEIIRHCDIASVRFQEDGSVMDFNGR